jgi:hypothetical protein
VQVHPLHHVLIVNIEDMGDADLLRHFGDVMTELRDRKLVRSANNPVADLAESLVADYYGGTVSDNKSEKSYDVAVGDDRLQVKGIRMTQKGRTTLSAIRSHAFTALVAVVFEPDFTPREALYVPLEVVQQYQGWSSTWKAHRLSVTKKLANDPRVTRIDGRHLLAAAQRRRESSSAGQP